MRIILLSIAVLFVGILNAQQINPIPDYVFKNQMSVGRNATTDTAAYFSVGPRFGATKGMMPPMVVDTASFSGSKRNGLLIFSVQKNKFLYWDSVRVQWSDMAGSSGQYITGTVTSGKIPKATSATVITDSRVSESGLLVSTPRFKIDSMLLVPKISMTPTDSGAVRYAVADSSLYVWTGSQWVKSLNSTDTTSLSNRINLKVNISDTSTMLSPYIRAAGYGLTKSGQSLLVDTAAIATRARVQKAVDSLGSLVSAGVTGTGVSGYMPEFTSTSVIDTTKLYHTSGKFGIGTTSPVGYLDVIGTKTPSAGEQEGIRVIGSLAARQGLSIGYDSTSADQYGIIASHTGSERTTLNYLAEKHKFTFGQVETAALYIDSIGNVGIGTASPNAKLEVAVSRTSSTNATSIILSDNVTGTQTNGVYKAIRSESNNRASVSEIRFIEMDGTNNNTAIGFATAQVSGGLAEAMRISNTQEVLIATTTDAGDYKLQVSGNIYNTGGAVLAATSGEILLGTTSDAGGYRLQINGNTYFASSPNTSLTTTSGLNYLAKGDNTYYTGFNFQGVAATDMFFGRTASSDDLVISTSNTGSPAERVRFKQNGNVGIGTASPSAGLEIQRAGASDHLTFSRSTSTGNANIKIGGNVSALVFENNSSAELMRLNLGGSVGIGTTLTTGKLNFENTTAVVTDGIIFTAANVAGTNHGFRIGINRQARAEVASSIKFLAENYSINDATYITFGTGTSDAERMRIKSDGEVLIGRTSDAGAYALQVEGAIYNTTGAAFAETSGNVAIGTISAAAKLEVSGSFSNSAIEEIARIARRGGTTAYSTDRAAGLTFYDEQNPTLTAAIAGIRNNASLNFLGGLGFYTSNNSGTQSLSITNLTRWMTLKNDGELLINTTSDAGAYKLQVDGAIYNTSTITTGAPTSGTAKPWRLGEAATVSPTSPNRTIRVEIDGTVYYIHAKTTND